MTFARLAKLLAVVLIAFALWRARPPAAPTRVIVLALPGAAVDLFGAGEENPPVVKEGVPAATVTTNGAAFWRHLFAWNGAARGDTELVSLWSGTEAPVRALGVPPRLSPPQIDAAGIRSVFVGSSGGAVVDAAELTSGRLPSPYDRAVDAVSTAAATLGRDQWSEWITVEPAPDPGAAAPAPVVQFQFARHSDTAYFFSPAYRIDLFTSGDVPFLRGVDRDLRPIAAAHLLALSRRRLESSQSSLAQPGDPRPQIYFDTVAEGVTGIFAPDSVPAAIVEQVRGAIAAEISILRRAVGDDGLVVVIGGPNTGRQSTTEAWFAMVGGDSTGGEHHIRPLPLQQDAGGAMVRYLAGVPLDAREKTLVPSAVTARVRLRPAVSTFVSPAAPEAPSHEWSASALESVPGAVDRGN